MRLNAVLALLVLALGAGCSGLRQAPVAEGVPAGFERNIRSAEELGIESAGVPGSQTVRWKERLSPKTPVISSMLPPESDDSAAPRVAAVLNGSEPISLCIDTGAALNILNVPAATRANVKVVDPEAFRNTFTGLGGSESNFYGMIDQLAVKTLDMKNLLTVLRVPQSFETEAALDNALGMSTLAKFAYLTIDYPKREVTFSVDTPFNPPASALGLPFTIESLHIVVEVAVRGEYAVNVLLDTGNDGTLMLTENLIQELGLEQEAAEGRKERYLGIGGVVETRAFNLSEIALAGESFTNVPVAVVPNSFPPALGSGFLRQFRVTIDFQRQTLWLERTSPILSRSEKFSFGKVEQPHP